jgi:hypothetical protein
VSLLIFAAIDLFEVKQKNGSDTWASDKRKVEGI